MRNDDPGIRNRKSIRLKGYDYSQAGAYFVTMVTWRRENLFGEVVDGIVQANRYGAIINKWWYEIPLHFPNVETGAFIVMPNHIHGIIVIFSGRGAVPAPEAENVQPGGGMTPPLQKPTLGQIIAYFKYQSTKEMNTVDDSGTITRFWQRNYYEHIIRNEGEMKAIWEYIESNPAGWETDDENPARISFTN